MMTRIWWVLVLMLSAALAIAAPGCGGDDDDDDDDDTEADDDTDDSTDITQEDCENAFSRLYGPDGCLVAGGMDTANISSACSEALNLGAGNSCLQDVVNAFITCLDEVSCTDSGNDEYAACNDAFNINQGSCG